MRSVIGVSLVRDVLHKSLVRAQNRFNLSNPQCESKGKLLKERIRERKLKNKLKHIARENRLLSGSGIIGEEDETNWNNILINPIRLEFEPSTDNYSDFVKRIRDRCTRLTSKAPESSSLISLQDAKKNKANKEARRGETKKLRKLKKLLKKQKSNSQSVGEDEEPLISSTLPKTKLELLRQQRIEIRKLKKELKKQAKQKKLEEVKQKQQIVKTMKDMVSSHSTSNNENGDINSCKTPSDTVDSASSCKIVTNVTAKLTVISNGVVKKSPAESCLPNPKITIFDRDNVRSGWTWKAPIGCGFVNMGNSCYMNATLQALFHIPSFVNWLSNDDAHRRKCQGITQQYHDCMVCAMANTLQESTNQNSSIRPMQIYSKLRSISKNFVHGRQEDAHEFLRYLLESMDNSYLRPIGAINIDSRSKETTPLGQIFGGYLRTQVTCLKCHFGSTTFQQLAELQLDIRHATTVEDAVSNHFRKEKVDNNDYKCEGCRMIVPVIKQFSLELPPIVLCLQLKRFTLFGGKLSKPVHCNRYLDLTKFQHPSRRAQNGNELKYRMVALITHIGSSPNGGHYTAIAEAANGNMYQFDDSSVRGVSPQMALNTDAYVIIYEMMSSQEKRALPSTPPQSTSTSAQIRNASMNGYSMKASTVTSISLNSQSPSNEAHSKSKLINNFKSPFGGQATPTSALGKKPVLIVPPVLKDLPKTPTNFQKSTPSPSPNGNARFISSEVKPRNERLPVSFSLKNSFGENNKSKTSNISSNLTPLKPSGRYNGERSPSPKKMNTKLQIPPPHKSKPLVPYENGDDSEEGTPRRNSRERSSTPKIQDVRVKKFDGNLITAPIKSWNGTESVLAKASEGNRKRQFEKTEADLYNEELDAGKLKKRKEDRSPSGDTPSINKFQNYEDRRRSLQERTKSLNFEPSIKPHATPSTPTPNCFKDSYRNHHHSSGSSASIGDARPPSYHQYNYSPQHGHDHSHNSHSRDNYFSRKGYNNQGFKRYNPSGSHDRFSNRGGGHYSGGGGGGGSGRPWRSNGSKYFHSNGNRSYTNYNHR